MTDRPASLLALPSFFTDSKFISAKQKMHCRKKCKSYNASSEISLSAMLCVACLPEIMEFIRANP